MQDTKGVILAGGTGSRLFPLTKAINKHLLNVYDKPLFYYPLSNILLAGINDISIVIDEKDYPDYLLYKKYFKSFNINIDLVIQQKPLGILDAVKLVFRTYKSVKSFIIILGDNFFYGESLPKIIKNALDSKSNTIFSYFVKNPEEYGILNNEKIIEKPQKPKSNLAVTGMYIYLRNSVTYSKKPKISIRGEYEITDLNNILLQKKLLKVIELGRGVVWLDAGSPERLINTSQFVNMVEKRQGLKIGCPEEIALNLNFIKKHNFLKRVNLLPESNYKNYLQNILKRV